MHCLMAATHDLKVYETKELSNYVMMPNKDFGDNAGKSAIVV